MNKNYAKHFKAIFMIPCKITTVTALGSHVWFPLCFAYEAGSSRQWNQQQGDCWPCLRYAHCWRPST